MRATRRLGHSQISSPQAPFQFSIRLPKKISTKQRGWTLDVLKILRRVMETKRQRAGALQNASRPTNASDLRASVLECGSPLPLSHSNSEPITFTNQDVYAFERELEQLHPGNRHIKDKIRQQLQNLARAGFLIHAGRNDYRVK